MIDQELEVEIAKKLQTSKKTGILNWQEGIEEVLKNQSMLEVIHRLAKC